MFQALCPQVLLFHSSKCVVLYFFRVFIWTLCWWRGTNIRYPFNLHQNKHNLIWLCLSFSLVRSSKARTASNWRNTEAKAYGITVTCDIGCGIGVAYKGVLEIIAALISLLFKDCLLKWRLNTMIIRVKRRISRVGKIRRMSWNNSKWAQNVDIC